MHVYVPGVGVGVVDVGQDCYSFHIPLLCINQNERSQQYMYTVKKVTDFPVFSLMSLTKLSLARNN